VRQARSHAPLFNKKSQVSIHSTQGVNTKGAGHGSCPAFVSSADGGVITEAETE